MTSVAVNTYTHSVVYVADNILKSLKDIIRLSGLDPFNFVNSWSDYMRALQTWLGSRDLDVVVLEIFDPKTDKLVGRWDIDVVYTTGAGNGAFWTDTDQIRYHVRKAGLLPSEAKYRLLLQNKAGRPDVEGWSNTQFRSTAGFVRHSLGSTVEHNGLGGSAAYWRTT
ncbi:MAG: HORMA domain containing protein [Nevskia sp.]|nr:HORMA domain containing protein [Nevskia sp.]